MVDRVRSCVTSTALAVAVVAQTEAVTCAALDAYIDATSDVQTGHDVGLHHSNVGRRKFRVTSGEAEHALDAFTARQFLRMVRADARNSGRLLDAFVRETSPAAPRGDASKAIECTRKAIRRLLATVEDCYEAAADGQVSPNEAEKVAARLRVLTIAATAWLPHLDARAAEGKR